MNNKEIALQLTQKYIDNRKIFSEKPDKPLSQEEILDEAKRIAEIFNAVYSNLRIDG